MYGRLIAALFRIPTTDCSQPRYDLHPLANLLADPAVLMLIAAARNHMLLMCCYDFRG